MGRVWAVVVAGGSGVRFGGAKQFADLGGVSVAERSVAACRAVADAVVLVVPAGQEDQSCGADQVVAGGASRAESVRCGLRQMPEDEGAVVVVHDAVRPLASPALFQAVVAPVAAGEADGAICAVPVTDTVKRVEGGVVVETLDRASLVAVQTPQAFRAAVLRRAHAGGAEATDDAALVEALGGTVRVVPGDPANVKLTAPEDLARLAQLLAAGNPVSR